MQSRARGGDDLRTNYTMKINGTEDEARATRPHPHAPRDPPSHPTGPVQLPNTEWRCWGMQLEWRCWGVRLPLFRCGGCSLASFLVVVA